MKKKGLLLVALLLCLCAFAFAEENTAETAELPADLFDLWDCGGESPVWAASAAPISEGILIAPVSVQDVPAEQLAVSDGVNAWEAAAIVPDVGDRFCYVFYDAGDTPAGYGYWPLLSWGEGVSASSCYVRYGDSLGSRINRGVLASEEVAVDGQRFLLLTLTDPAPTGSPVLTQDGRIAGVVAAQWAEGGNRVLVMPAEGIASSVSDVAQLLLNLPGWGEAPEGLVVTAEKNTVTIDWSAMALPEAPEGSDVWMVIMDTGNSYLTSFPAVQEERAITLVLTPGRFYIAGPVVSAGRPTEIPASYVSVFIPRTGKLTEFAFKPVRTCIAEAPEGGLKEGEAPVPVTEVTEELLSSDRAYFYSESTYEVTESVERSLLVTLSDPLGNNYRFQSGWLYAPEYMADDIWYLNLKETGLTDALNAGGWAAGTYRMAFWVDGQLADEFEFELTR